MNPFEIARVAHEINRAYCVGIGDTQVPTWEEASIEHRESMTRAVQRHLSEPPCSLEEQHERWREARKAEGWVPGEKKDDQAKTHPNLVPWAELPQEQKVKDYLFRAVVNALRDR